MIITQFRGRLGNQLFEYAAGRKFAIDGNTELKLDLGNYERANKMDAHRIRFFNIIENIATEEECKKLKKKDFLYYMEKLLPYYKRRFVWEKNWTFDKNLIGIKRRNMYVRGQFQSEEYFKGIENILRDEFTLKQPLDSRYKELLDKIKSVQSVSIHIRRGDFMSVVTNNPLMPVSYYKNAVEYIKEKIPSPHFFIFSDDIEWAKKNLSFIEQIEFVSQPDMCDYEELTIMSRCKHNIIGNSTFSWWGAWLNIHPDKIVISPKNWLGDTERNKIYVSHLLPESWIQI